MSTPSRSAAAALLFLAGCAAGGPAGAPAAPTSGPSGLEVVWIEAFGLE